MTVRLGEALLFALWGAGCALVIFTMLAWLAEWWSNFRNRRTILGPLRIERNFSLKDLPVFQRLADEMEIAGVRAPIEVVVGLMVFIGVAGWFVTDGSVFQLQQRFALDADRLASVNTWVLNTAVAFLLASLPLFYIKFRLQRKRHRIALDMIKLVQNVISFYSPSRTVQEVISRSVSTMPDHVRTEWKRLEAGVHMGTSLEEALYDFARRADNGWADDLADILLIKHRYGNDIIDALHKLVVDMQIARKNEERRLAMVTVYRIGTSIMAGFAVFIIFFNVYADGANYRHYFMSSTGKSLLLFSAAVMFISMVLVVRSGRRTF